MSPRHEPTETRRWPSDSVAGSQSRSQLAGLGRGVQEVLERNHLNCFALGAHLVGQAICDPIDARHQAILPPEVWGDGDPAGVKERAAERMKDTARAAAAFGVSQVNGFTGSAV